jgi:hypothetical protein
MLRRRLLVLLTVFPVTLGGAVLGASAAGCELAVEIDRGLVDAGAGADGGPCPICSRPGGDAGDATDDAPTADGGIDSGARRAKRSRP